MYMIVKYIIYFRLDPTWKTFYVIHICHDEDILCYSGHKLYRKTYNDGRNALAVGDGRSKRH